MKRIAILVLTLTFAVGTLAAPAASAGWFDKGKSKRTEKPDWMKKPQRYDGPRMAFQGGLLEQDGFTGWKLGGASIHFAKDCEITDGKGGKGSLLAGREAIAMGPRFGNTIVAWTVRMVDPNYRAEMTMGSDVLRKPSAVNPECGELVSAPQ